jgi:hypothetical protein
MTRHDDRVYVRHMLDCARDAWQLFRGENEENSKPTAPFAMRSSTQRQLLERPLPMCPKRDGASIPPSPGRP